MPRQHAEFFSSLAFLPVGTLDERGRPWASILVTLSNEDSSIGVTASTADGLVITANVSPHDPFFRSLDTSIGNQSNSEPLFAAVGIDFATRRRNKLAGTISSATLDRTGKSHLRLNSNEHLGNCPKYITVRSLVPCSRTPRLALDEFDSLKTPLPLPCKEVIDRASTLFLATTHVPSAGDAPDAAPYMGLNHRGGAPGFVRLCEEPREGGQVDTYLVLPDYSGNRFYQSLGNIQSSALVGLVFPDFSAGHALHVTGTAENLFDTHAEEVMPRMSLITRVRVTGAVFIESALSLRMDSEEQLSPYNPPLRYLQRELEAMGRPVLPRANAEDPVSATLVSARKLSTTVSTFSLQLSKPVEAVIPGGFGIFDFSQVLDSGYSHMNESNPQAVNEDYVRTWTVSSSPDIDPKTRRFCPVDTIEVTVKHQPKGLISSFLHRQGDLVANVEEPALTFTLRGTGGQFSCLTRENSAPRVPPRMLWVAGGVGITPFMSMWDGIRQVLEVAPAAFSTDIVLVFAARDDDLNLVRHFLESAGSLLPSVSLRILAHQSVGPARTEGQSARESLTRDYGAPLLSIREGRLTPADLERVENPLDREAFLCGPADLMRTTREWLRSRGDGSQLVHQESFFF